MGERSINSVIYIWHLVYGVKGSCVCLSSYYRDVLAAEEPAVVFIVAVSASLIYQHTNSINNNGDWRSCPFKRTTIILLVRFRAMTHFFYHLLNRPQSQRYLRYLYCHWDYPNCDCWNELQSRMLQLVSLPGPRSSITMAADKHLPLASLVAMRHR